MLQALTGERSVVGVLRTGSTVRREPLLPPVAQLSGSAFCGKRTAPPFCRRFCRFPITPSFPKAVVPVAFRAGHPLPRSPRLRGERGGERPPSIFGMDGPETGGCCRPFCRFRGRSPAAPAARFVPAGRRTARLRRVEAAAGDVTDRRGLLDAEGGIEALTEAADGLVGPLPDVGEPEGRGGGELVCRREVGGDHTGAPLRHARTAAGVRGLRRRCARRSGSGARGRGFEGVRSLPSPVPLYAQGVGWLSCRRGPGDGVTGVHGGAAVVIAL